MIVKIIFSICISRWDGNVYINLKLRYIGVGPDWAPLPHPQLGRHIYSCLGPASLLILFIPVLPKRGKMVRGEKSQTKSYCWEDHTKLTLFLSGRKSQLNIKNSPTLSTSNSTSPPNHLYSFLSCLFIYLFLFNSQIKLHTFNYIYIKL